MNKKALELRITDLESKLAFQDQTIDDLDAQVQKLNTILESLQLYTQKLEQRLLDLPSSAVGDTVVVHEKPPHY